MNNQSQANKNNRSTKKMTDEDWFNQGKADAWANKPKSPPEEDPKAASMYELGYCEGKIERPTIKPDS
ncbi:MAG: hypothetical protein D6756_11925 [Cyanobacteria bacterium J083]|nr:MAG: hypothetical protein D6756_11925 [Cyanobacteria bacterium J083]